MVADNATENIDNKSMLVNLRRKLRRLKWKYFRTNSAFWFCGRLGLCASSVGSDTGNCDTHISIEFDDLPKSIEYIKTKSKEFPWIYVPRELETAISWRHYYPIIYLRGEIAGYIKIALGKAYLEDFDDFIALKDDEAFICDTFISPEYRGKGLAKVLVEQTSAYLSQKEIRYLFCHIPSWNTVSLNLYTGLGFKRIRNVWHVRIPACRFYSCHPKRVLAEGRSIFEKAGNSKDSSNKL